MEIKIYEDKYRDDMIAMVLQAKAALGRPSSLNEDLLDIKANYFQRGDMFWVAVDDDDRVVGCGGYSKTENAEKAFVHRLYVKASKSIKVSARHFLPRLKRECVPTVSLLRWCISGLRGSNGVNHTRFIRNTDMSNAA